MTKSCRTVREMGTVKIWQVWTLVLQKI